MNTEEKQELITLVFTMVLIATDDKVFCKKSRGERMAWVANNLREICDIDTHPIGSSWGVIVSPTFREDIPIMKDNLDF